MNKIMIEMPEYIYKLLCKLKPSERPDFVMNELVLIADEEKKLRETGSRWSF